jgi:hypothetical protein
MYGMMATTGYSGTFGWSSSMQGNMPANSGERLEARFRVARMTIAGIATQRVWRGRQLVPVPWVMCRVMLPGGLPLPALVQHSC